MEICERRSRKRNWDESDTYKLLELVEIHYDRLFGKFSAQLTNTCKKNLWNSIAESFEDRSGEECRHKFQKVKSENVIVYNRHRKQMNATGGGPPPKPLSAITEKVISLMGTSNPRISGIEGGIDTAVPTTPTQRKRPIFSGSCSFDSSGHSNPYPNKSPKLCENDSIKQRSPRKESKVSVDELLRQNLEKQHHLVMEKVKKEMELVDLQMNVAKLQYENELKRKEILEAEAARGESDRYAFLH